MHYYVGFANGAAAADKENNNNNNNTVYYHGGCPADHTNEYCTGFKTGWNAEVMLIWRNHQ